MMKKIIVIDDSQVDHLNYSFADFLREYVDQEVLKDITKAVKNANSTKRKGNPRSVRSRPASNSKRQKLTDKRKSRKVKGRSSARL